GAAAGAPPVADSGGAGAPAAAAAGALPGPAVAGPPPAAVAGAPPAAAGAGAPPAPAAGLTTAPRPLTPVTVAVPATSLPFLPLHIAKQRGFDQQNGLDLQVQMIGGTTS